MALVRECLMILWLRKRQWHMLRRHWHWFGLVFLILGRILSLGVWQVGKQKGKVSAAFGYFQHPHIKEEEE
jgi:hypothetical protein